MHGKQNQGKLGDPRTKQACCFFGSKAANPWSQITLPNTRLWHVVNVLETATEHASLAQSSFHASCQSRDQGILPIASANLLSFLHEATLHNSGFVLSHPRIFCPRSKNSLWTWLRQANNQKPEINLGYQEQISHAIETWSPSVFRTWMHLQAFVTATSQDKQATRLLATWLLFKKLQPSNSLKILSRTAAGFCWDHLPKTLL